MNFGLYIHWPFCLKKCPYCDFNSYVLEHSEEDFINGLLKELEIQYNEFKDYEIQTIFFGGGTPSLIHPKNIKRIIDKALSLWKYKENLEITIEVNPSSIETHKLEGFLEAGIKRISIGMQSLDDNKLKFLGRLHSSEQAIKILKEAALICKNVSADFIYALPSDTLDSWKKDSQVAMQLIQDVNIKHASFYELVIEENTNFYTQVHNKEWTPMEEDLQSKLYQVTQNRLKEMNWDFYEISNSCYEAHNETWQCKHNLIYWRYENYLGIGPGAHSRMIKGAEKFKFNNFKAPHKWLNSVNTTHIKEDHQALTTQEMMQEKLIMGLRLKEGVKLSQEEFKQLNYQGLELLESKKIITVTSNGVKINEKHILKLNSVINAIL